MARELARRPPLDLEHAFDPEKDRRIFRTGDVAGGGWLFGRDSSAGKVVTGENALTLDVVFACVRLIAQAIATLPLKLYEKTTAGRVELADHPLAAVLADPNADQTAFEFWEGLVARAVLNGNGYAHKRFQGRFLSALVPLVAVPRRDRLGDLVYDTFDRGQLVTLPRDEVFHVKGFGLGGDEGLSAIRFGANTLGTALAAEEAAAKFFANGLMASGVIHGEHVLKKEQRDQLQETLEKYRGSPNAFKLLLLEAGLKYQTMLINPDDAQLLDARGFHVEQGCRWFGVPPIMVGHAGQGQTMWGSGVEQILLSFLVLGVNPIANRIEQRIRKQLIGPAERRRVYAEYNREALLQMDSKAKAEFLASLTQNGLMSRLEGRAKLNLPPTGQAGEELLTAQTNLAPLGELGANAVRDRGQPTTT